VAGCLAHGGQTREISVAATLRGNTSNNGERLHNCDT
jgi:hypothetical protein